MKKSIAFICSEPGNGDIIEKFDVVIDAIGDWAEYNSDNPGVITHYDIDCAEEFYNDDDDEDNYDFAALRNWMKENGIDVII